MYDNGQRLVIDGSAGFRRLDPIPEAEELATFYESAYYELIRRGERDAGMARLLVGGEQADEERRWRDRTLYADIADRLVALCPGGRVLDVGCGTGDLVARLATAGLAAQGIEPSVEAVEVAVGRGLAVEAASLEEYAALPEAHGFEAVLLLNVLEHVPDPRAFLRLVRSVLRPGGIVYVKVPNDFTELQASAVTATGHEPWWVAVPDHINYFDYGSLASVLAECGFGVFARDADFPMELFLLMGDDYITDPDVGRACHKRRVMMETAMTDPLRRRLYGALAESGLSRCAIAWARASDEAGTA